MRTNNWLSYEDNRAEPTVERQPRLYCVDHRHNPSIPWRILCRWATTVDTRRRSTAEWQDWCECVTSCCSRRIYTAFMHKYTHLNITITQVSAQVSRITTCINMHSSHTHAYHSIYEFCWQLKCKFNQSCVISAMRHSLLFNFGNIESSKQWNQRLHIILT